MKRTLIILLLLAANCLGATYYVRTNGSNSNNGLANTAGGAWLTLAHAESNSTTGDIIRVQAGSYNLGGTLTVDVDGSGTAIANRRIFVADGAVTLTGQVDIQGNYTWFIGFTVTNSSGNLPGFRLSDNTIGAEVRDCRTQGTDGEGIAVYAGCNGTRIIGNYIDRPSVSGYPTFVSDANASIWMRGTNTSPISTDVLVAYNVMDNSPDFIIVGGQWVQLLNNVAGPNNPSVVPHVDGAQADGGARDVLIEGYMHFENRSPDNHFNHFDVNTANRIIFRHNVIASKGGMGFYSSDNDRVYNQTFWNNNYTTAQSQIGAGDSGTDDLQIFNNLFYFSNPSAGGTGIGSLNANNVRTNNASFGQPNWSEVGSVTSNPLFVSDTDQDHLTLQSGSPLRGAGRYITLANGTGSSSTALIVDDAYGLFPGDAILVGGSATSVVTRNSATSLTITPSISWSDNAQIVLAKNPNKDIGAIPFGATYLTAATYTASGSNYTGTPNGNYRWWVWYEDGIPRETDTTSPSYTSSGGTVTAKAYALWAQAVPVVTASLVGGGAPTVTSATINAAGTQFAVNFSEAVFIGTGGGMTITASGGAVSLGTPSIAGSTITYPITGRVIGIGETVTMTYAQPGNGIENSAGTDLASFSGQSVTNNSTQPQAVTPVFSPAPGAYSSTQNVTMTSSTPGATIRYTTNGTDPTASSTLYTAPVPTSLNTTYRARAFAAGYIDSPIAIGAYSIGDFVITNAWTNIPVATQTGTFTWTFRATSSVANNDAVMALADHTATGYADLAVIARFGPGGVIDAYNGVTSAYAAVNSFPYVAGQAYDFSVSVNIPAHTYSMTVVQAGGSTPVTIASNYGFRGASVSAVDLDVFAAFSSSGTVTVDNMIFSGAAGISVTSRTINTAGTQVTLNFNSQPSFGVGGQGGFTITASGGVVTAASPTIGTNAITWTLSRTIGRGETVSGTYVQPGNGIEAASGGADLASFAGQTVVNNSTVDLTAPIPNPSTFSIAPTPTGSSTITMTATTSTDAFTGPVQYFFNETSGNAGGSDSGWQTSPTFTDTGLAAGTQYTYRVQTRDSASTPNVTTFSASASATTRSVAGAHPASPFNVARANILTP